MKREIIKLPKAEKQAVLCKALGVKFWTKEKFSRLKRNLVVHSSS